MDVVYDGIRLTPAQIAASAQQEGVHVIGLSILSGSHRELIPAVMEALRARGVQAPVIVGGIIPEQDVPDLLQDGAAAVYTPKDFDITRIMREIVALLAAEAERPALAAARRARVSPAGAALAARLRERDLTAAPAALNLLESNAPEERREAASLLAALSPAALGEEAPGHVIGVTGPPGAGKSTMLSALLAGWRGRGRTVALLAVDPSSRRSGGSLLGDRARIDFDAGDSGVLIRSSAAGERLGGLARSTASAAEALAVAFDVVVIETVGVGQAETDVAEASDTVVGRRAARRRRRAAVPQVGDHGGPRRARDHEGGPRPAGDRRTRRDLSAALRSLGPARRRCSASPPFPRPSGIEELLDAIEAHRASVDVGATAPGPAVPGRSGSSSPSTASGAASDRRPCRGRAAARRRGSGLRACSRRWTRRARATSLAGLTAATASFRRSLLLASALAGILGDEPRHGALLRASRPATVDVIP